MSKSREKRSKVNELKKKIQEETAVIIEEKIKRAVENKNAQLFVEERERELKNREKYLANLERKMKIEEIKVKKLLAKFTLFRIRRWLVEKWRLF